MHILTGILKMMSVKEYFEYELQQGMKELDRTIEGRIKECEEQFRKDIQKRCRTI
ncbi:hypothetical protein ID0203_03430 [Helicobacter pylori]